MCLKLTFPPSTREDTFMKHLALWVRSVFFFCDSGWLPLICLKHFNQMNFTWLEDELDKSWQMYFNDLWHKKMLGFTDINMTFLLPSCPLFPWARLVPAAKQCSMPVRVCSKPFNFPWPYPWGRTQCRLPANAKQPKSACQDKTIFHWTR